MIKEKEVTKTFKEKHKYCDECGKEIRTQYSTSHCKYCGKDLCRSCIGHEEDDTGDYSIVYCKKCWELGNDYRLLIRKLDDEIDGLYEEWQDKCKK